MRRSVRGSGGRCVGIEITDGELSGGADTATADTRHSAGTKEIQETLVRIVTRNVVANHAHVRLVQAKDGITVSALLFFNGEWMVYG